MMRLPRVVLLACVVLLVTYSSSRAAIVGVVETNLGADAPAIAVNGGFAEDALALADRDHQHNGPRFTDAFGAGTLLLSPSGFGTTVVNVPLPSYMVGGDYVRFANDARDNIGYSATITASTPAKWYLLLDNRWDGPNAANDGTFFDDPILGGNLQWVIDDGWQRMNTGLSPVSIFGAVGDYTGLDEFQNSDPNTLGVGPGILVDNFYAVYGLPGKAKTISTGSLAMSGATMYTVVAVVPEPASIALLACSALGLVFPRRFCRQR